MDAAVIQLSEARRNCQAAIDSTKAASARDGVDRSNSIAILTRDLGKFEKQLKDRGYTDSVTVPADEPLPEKSKPKSK